MTVLWGNARKWWGWITLRRHRSELRALQTARLMPPLAIFPILLTIGGWYFLLVGVPGLPLFLLQHVLYGLDPIIGSVVFAFNSVLAIVALCFILPWFFRWYFIAASLMAGRSGMADRKEGELISAIRHAEATTGTI